MNMSFVLMALPMIFFLGHFLNWFFKKTKVPDLLILMGLGQLAVQMHWIHQDTFGISGQIIALLALILILYEGGLSLKTQKLVEAALPASLLILGGFLGTLFLTALSVRFFGKDWSLAFLTGMALSCTSSAIVLPMVRSLNIGEKMRTILSLEASFTDVLAIVFFLFFVEVLQKGQSQIQIHTLLYEVIFHGFVSVLIGFFLGYLWMFLRSNVHLLERMFFATESWVVFSYALAESFHLNGPLAVLAIGFIFANSPLWISFPSLQKKYKIRLKALPSNELVLLKEVSLLLRNLFFIYLGTLFRFSSLSMIFMAFGITCVIFIIRYLMVVGFFSPSFCGRKDAMVLCAMGPRGLACAVLATIAVQRGIFGAHWLQDLVFAIIAMTTVGTSLMVICTENNLFGKLSYSLFKKYSDSDSRSGSSSGSGSNPKPRTTT